MCTETLQPDFYFVIKIHFNIMEFKYKLFFIIFTFKKQSLNELKMGLLKEV